jgi:D-beta-D-heptose 7-phosphate kinase/D-beta-D-heptose 1-phosphate adenosyltransferase
MTNKTIMVSGGFDPIHVGHVRMILAAAELGNVIVAVNSDSWLMRKKGYIFMPWEERAEIIKAVNGVTDVVAVGDSDGTVCEVLKRLKPDMFGNGGDRTNKNTPEMAVCEKLKIEMIWGLGGGKIQSSTELVKDANWAPLSSDDPEAPRPDKSIFIRDTKGKNSENQS